MLGTVVMIHIEAPEGMGTPECERSLHRAADAALSAIGGIERAMSAHRPDSDLGRMANASPGATLTVDPHTVSVLKLVRHWYSLSRGAFDPVAAADRLARFNLRPAFRGDAGLHGTLRDIQVVSANEVLLERPVRLDFGGIAKGYAVDLAVETLRQSGIHSALVNAGGDLRSIGPRAWPVEVRGRVGFRSDVPRAMRRACGLAIASSEAAGPAGDFVRTAREVGAARWSSCTVMAKDCVTADAFTKWGLQAGESSPRLRRALRTYGARLWRS